MKVKQLIQKLSQLDPELEVGIKWLHAINPVHVVGIVKLGKNFRRTKRAGKFEYVILSSFDIDINQKY